MNLIRQLTRREAGGWDRLANYNKEQSWDLSAGLRGVWADRFDWELSVGRSRYTVDEYIRTVDTARATDYFLGSSSAPPPMARRSMRSTRRACTRRCRRTSTTRWSPSRITRRIRG